MLQKYIGIFLFLGYGGVLAKTVQLHPACVMCSMCS
jgi:hypothetical protein